MSHNQEADPQRRKLLKAGLFLAVPGALWPLAGNALAPTPEIPDADDPTPAIIEGPYYKPKAPERASLVEKGAKGTVITLAGRVLDTDGNPLPEALVDFWQADADGVYDNAGFKYRGWHRTNKKGEYKLETIMPGPYPGRTPHIHVKVAPPKGRVLTTQLYFPGVAANQRDHLYKAACLVKKIKDKENQLTFDFVLKVD